MRTRVTALAAVVAFAMAVAAVAVLAGRGSDQELVKLPVGSYGGGTAEDAAASTSARSALAYPDFGNIEYRVDGRLPDLSSTAPAYRLTSSATPADVDRLAAALGLDGPVRTEENAWLVSGGAYELRVERLPGLPWYLGPSCQDIPVSSSDTAGVSMCAAPGVVMGGGTATSIEPVCKDGTAECAPAQSEPVPADAPPPPPSVASQPPTTVACPPDAGCVVPEPCPPGETCAFTGAYPSPTPPEKPPRPDDFPSRQEAERLAKEAFTRLGVDLDGFAIDDGWVTWDARVEPRVDGLRVFGLGASLSLGAKGEVVRASGFLAQPERIGDYPLVGLETGLERLRENVGIGPRPYPAQDGGSFPPGAEPADLPAGGPAVQTDQAEPVDAVPMTTVPLGSDPAIGDCSKPTVICDPPPGVTVAPPPGAPLPPEPVPEPQPVVRRVSGAHLALLQVDAVLVPVYVFELDGGEETFPVPAVTDEWLEQQTPPTRALKD